MANKVLTTVVRMIFLVCIIIPVILCTIGFFSIGKLFGSIILVLSTVLVFVFVWAVSKSKTGSEKILITVIAIGIAIRLFYSLFIDKEPLSDQLVCYNAAQALLKGDLSWAKNEYFVHYPFQIPFILYESLILRIFGSIRALYAFNGLFSIATCFLVYLIAKTLTNRHAALISTAIYALLPSSIFMIHWLYNYTIFGVFFLLSILFFIKFCKAQFLAKITFKCILNCVLTGLFLSISNLFRGEGIIGILAALVWF